MSRGRFLQHVDRRIGDACVDGSLEDEPVYGRHGCAFDRAVTNNLVNNGIVLRPTGEAESARRAWQHDRPARRHRVADEVTASEKICAILFFDMFYNGSTGLQAERAAISARHGLGFTLLLFHRRSARRHFIAGNVNPHGRRVLVHAGSGGGGRGRGGAIDGASVHADGYRIIGGRGRRGGAVSEPSFTPDLVTDTRTGKPGYGRVCRRRLNCRSRPIRYPRISACLNGDGVEVIQRYAGGRSPVIVPSAFEMPTAEAAWMPERTITWRNRSRSEELLLPAQRRCADWFGSER